MNTYDKITPIETNYNAIANFKMSGSVIAGATGSGAISIEVSPAPKYDTGLVKLYNPDDNTLYEDVYFSANDAGVLTIAVDGRGKNDTTILSAVTTDFKLFFPADVDFMRHEIDAILADVAFLSSLSTFTVSPQVPLVTTEDGQVMSRAEIIANYTTGIAGVSSINGETGALTSDDLFTFNSTKLINSINYLN